LWGGADKLRIENPRDKGPAVRIAGDVDFSAVLIAPYSALIAVAALVAAIVSKRSRPRLVWPFLFSTLTAAAVFVGPPKVSELEYWLASLFGTAVWTAMGTAIGALSVELVRATVRVFRGQ